MFFRLLTGSEIGLAKHELNTLPTLLPGLVQIL